MATLTIPNLDPVLEQRLRVRAAEHGLSIEAEAKLILQSSLGSVERSGANLYDRIRARFDLVDGGADIPIPPREPMGELPTFD